MARRGTEVPAAPVVPEHPLVAVVLDRYLDWLSKRVADPLAILARGTLVGGEGFGYQIVVIKRAGIKTIKGKEIVSD